MKKVLLVLALPILLTVGCAPEAKGQLPPPPAGSYTVVLDASSSKLTKDDSSAAYTVELKTLENESVTYKVEIGAPMYLKDVSDGTKTYTEMIVKPGAYFKSKSNYTVSRIRCDIYEGRGINYEVHNKANGSGTKLEEHKSDVTPVYAADSGAVYEYEVNANEWSITNPTNYKPAFYSVTIIFEVK